MSACIQFSVNFGSKILFSLIESNKDLAFISSKSWIHNVISLSIFSFSMIRDLVLKTAFVFFGLADANWANKASFIFLLNPWIGRKIVNFLLNPWIKSFVEIDTKPWICEDRELEGRELGGYTVSEFGRKYVYLPILWIISRLFYAGLWHIKHLAKQK